jgi:hypothetical protein
MSRAHVIEALPRLLWSPLLALGAVRNLGAPLIDAFRLVTNLAFTLPEAHHS